MWDVHCTVTTKCFNCGEAKKKKIECEPMQRILQKIRLQINQINNGENNCCNKKRIRWPIIFRQLWRCRRKPLTIRIFIEIKREDGRIHTFNCKPCCTSSQASAAISFDHYQYWPNHFPFDISPFACIKSHLLCIGIILNEHISSYLNDFKNWFNQN